MKIPGINENQLEIIEKVLINSANLILATLILGNILNPKGFNLKLFVAGCIMFFAVVSIALEFRRKEKTAP